MERWKWIEGYEGRYRVSDQGQVMSVGSTHKNPLIPGTLSARKPRILSPLNTTDGYLKVGLCDNGNQCQYLIHRLVLAAFGPPADPARPECNHIDGDKHNNRIENLEWASMTENIRHAHDIGLFDRAIGEHHYKAKLTERDVRAIRQLYAAGAHSMYELAAMFGVSRPNVGYIINRKIWKHI